MFFSRTSVVLFVMVFGVSSLGWAQYTQAQLDAAWNAGYQAGLKAAGGPGTNGHGLDGVASSFRPTKPFTKGLPVDPSAFEDIVPNAFDGLPLDSSGFSWKGVGIDGGKSGWNWNTYTIDPSSQSIKIVNTGSLVQQMKVLKPTDKLQLLVQDLDPTTLGALEGTLKEQQGLKVLVTPMQ